jgi:enamine deaminase RidA (YjgF/YER057c/UK114 family)
VRETWERGEQIYGFIIHRQWGKSRMGCVMSLEECLRAANTNVIYITDTKTHAEQIVIPLMNQLLEDCPKHLRPKFSRERRSYEFHNGSTLTILGLDFDGLDKVRGVRARFVFIDEAAFQEQIKEALATILPVLSTVGGFCLLATTPPSMPGHPFFSVYESLLQLGAVVRIPLDQNPDATPAMRRAAEQYRKLLGDAAYAREWLCDMSGVGDDSIVFPEWVAVRQRVVQQVKDLPPRCDHYIGWDIGGRDWDAFCFATWDHEKGRLVVQGELFLRADSIGDMAAKVKAKIAELEWEKNGGRILMFADHNNKHLVNEFGRTYGLRFLPTAKPEKVAQIQEIKSLMQDGELFIVPDCAVLIRTMERARFDRTHKGFLRAEQADLEKMGLLPIGHCDMIDALVYTAVNVRRHLSHAEPRKMSTLERRHAGLRDPEPHHLAGKTATQAVKDAAKALLSMLGPAKR